MAKAAGTGTASEAERPVGSEPLTPERLLARAAQRVAGGWCQASLAEDRHGREVEPWNQSACRWSPLGALLAVWVEDRCRGGDAFEIAYAALALAAGGRLEEWNAAPWRTSWHVRSAFARAPENLAAAREQVPER